MARNSCMIDFMRDDMECEDLFRCVFGFGDLEIECYQLLVSQGDMSVDELAERVGRERSTVHRAVSGMVDEGVVEKERVGYSSGGYYESLSAVSGDALSGELRSVLLDWVVEINGLIDEFEEEFVVQDSDASHSE